MGGLFLGEMQRLIEHKGYNRVTELIDAFRPDSAELELVLSKAVEKGERKIASLLIDAGALPGVKTAEACRDSDSWRIIHTMLFSGMKLHAVPYILKAELIGMNSAVLLGEFAAFDDSISGAEAFVWDDIIHDNPYRRRAMKAACGLLARGGKEATRFYEDFMETVISGSPEAVKEKLKRVRLPARLKLEQPAIFASLSLGRAEILGVLLKAGFNPDVRLCYVSETALNMTVKKGDLYLYDMLQDAGAVRFDADAMFRILGMYDRRAPVMVKAVRDFRQRFREIPWTAVVFPVSVMRELHKFGLLGLIRKNGHILTCEQVRHKINGFNKDAFEYYLKYGQGECGCGG